MVGERGWPLVYWSDHDTYYSDKYEFDHTITPWAAADNWRFFALSSVSAWPLVIDVALAAATLLATAAALDWRRRHRRSFLRTTIRELIVATIVFALFFAWLAITKYGYDREQAAAGRLEPFIDIGDLGTRFWRSDRIDCSPAWLSALIHRRHRRWFERRTELWLTFFDPPALAAPDDLLAFSHLNELTVDGPLCREDALVALIEQNDISILRLTEFPLQGSTLQLLARKPSIQKIGLSQIPLTEAEVRAFADSPVKDRHIYFSEIEVTDAMIRLLVQSPSIWSLTLEECHGFSENIDEAIFEWQPEGHLVWSSGSVLHWQRDLTDEDDW